MMGPEGGLTDTLYSQGALAFFVFIYINKLVFKQAVTLEKAYNYVLQMDHYDKLQLV